MAFVRKPGSVVTEIFKDEADEEFEIDFKVPDVEDYSKIEELQERQGKKKISVGDYQRGVYDIMIRAIRGLNYDDGSAFELRDGSGKVTAASASALIPHFPAIHEKIMSLIGLSQHDLKNYLSPSE